MNRIFLQRKRQIGVTMVELLIYIALTGISAGALYSVLISNFKSYDALETRLVMHQDLRAAMDMMVREIRMAGCNPEETMGWGFQDNPDDRYDTDANSVHFTMDLDGDSDVNSGPEQGEDVGYYLESTPETGVYNLMRRANYGNAALSAEVLVGNVTDFQLSYFEQDGTTAVTTPGTSSGSVYFVDIEMEMKTAKKDLLTGEVKTQRLESRVRIRNAGI